MFSYNKIIYDPGEIRVIFIRRGCFNEQIA